MTIPISSIAPWVAVACLSASAAIVSSLVLFGGVTLGRWILCFCTIMGAVVAIYILTQHGYIIWK